MQRVRKDGWTKTKRARFLDMLAGTCNVRLSAEAAEMPPDAAYRLKRTDPEFADLWREALAAGYDRLETALVGRALESVNAIEPGDGGAGIEAAATAAVAVMDIRTALILLGRHRATVEGRGRRTSREARRRIATEEETNAAILKKLAVLKRQMEREP